MNHVTTSMSLQAKPKTARCQDANLYENLLELHVFDDSGHWHSPHVQSIFEDLVSDTSHQ